MSFMETSTVPYGTPPINPQGPWPWGGSPEVADSHWLDNRIYTDTRIFALEQERIFRGQWKFLCHESEIPEPGDFRSTEVGGVPLVVLRDEAGTIRTFFNICPHRGAALVREVRGKLPGNRLRCFYHHWTFTTDGKCAHIPLPHGYGESAIKAENVFLREVLCDSKLGLIFACIESNEATPSLDSFLGPALNHLAEPIADLEVFHYHRVNVRANWKNFVETNAEGYHELLHLLNRTTGLSQPEYLKRKWLIHGNGHHTFAPAQIAYQKLKLGDRGEDTLPGMTANMHVVSDIFPDVMVNARSTVVRIDSLIPLAPGLTALECRGLAPKTDTPEQRRQRIRQHNEVWGPMGRNLPEDIWAVETQWRNLASGGLPTSVIAREDHHQATDDEPVRNFYAEWQRLLGIAVAHFLANTTTPCGEQPND